MSYHRACCCEPVPERGLLLSRCVPLINAKRIDHEFGAIPVCSGDPRHEYFSAPNPGQIVASPLDYSDQEIWDRTTKQISVRLLDGTYWTPYVRAGSSIGSGPIVPVYMRRYTSPHRLLLWWAADVSYLTLTARDNDAGYNRTYYTPCCGQLKSQQTAYGASAIWDVAAGLGVVLVDPDATTEERELARFANSRFRVARVSGTLQIYAEVDDGDLPTTIADVDSLITSWSHIGTLTIDYGSPYVGFGGRISETTGFITPGTVWRDQLWHHAATYDRSWQLSDADVNGAWRIQDLPGYSGDKRAGYSSDSSCQHYGTNSDTIGISLYYERLQS